MRVPGPPQRVRATSMGSTQIKLEWDEPVSAGNSAIRGYKILMQTSGSGGFLERVKDSQVHHHPASPCSTRNATT